MINTYDHITQQRQQAMLKVLIADDDLPTRILLRAAISQWGYEVIEARDGEEAWEILHQSDAPGILIVDWLMPRLNGVDLCARIKRELMHHPYTILLTQVTGTENIIKGLEAGADEFLAKPFNMAELRSRLSVGARMVKFESLLAQQTQELQWYISQIESLNLLVPQLSQEINSFLKQQETLEVNAEKMAHSLKLQELQKQLENLITTIKNLPENKQNTGG